MSQYSLIHIPPYKFLLPLRELKEVRIKQSISPVPKSPDYVLGLFPLRGSLCSLLCLPTLLGFQKNDDNTSKVIIVDHEVGLFALEAVHVDIVSFLGSPNPAPENLPFFSWTSGMFSTEKGEFFILDFGDLQNLITL